MHPTRNRNRGDHGTADERLVQALKNSGPQTLDRLAASSGMSWSELFFAVDRLSRTGKVTIRRLRRCEYEVSLGLLA
jgi:hypothetical protein